MSNRNLSRAALSAASAEIVAWLPEQSGRRPLTAPDPKEAATYSRFSTLMQKEVSIERQREVCRDYAQEHDLRISPEHEFADRARSGAYMAGREGLEAMVAAAKAGKFSTLLVEHLDRIGRDLGLSSTVYKQLLNAGVSIHQPGRGRLSITDVAIQGLMGDESRRQMAERAQFSRNVMAHEGKVPSGKCFGYAAVPGSPGEIVIDEREAEIVRRVYGMRLDGLNPRQICSILHAEGIRSSRNRRFTASGIKRLLKQDRYAGIIVYGRHACHKDRDTGKRKVSVRPRKDWIVSEQPSLRIVDLDVWERVQALWTTRKLSRTEPSPRASSYMLTGLVICPGCERPMAATGGPDRRRRFYCVRARADGTCDHGRSVSVQNLESAVLTALGQVLDRPGFADAYLAAYNDECRKAEDALGDRRARLQKEVADHERKLFASFDAAYTKGFSSARISSLRAILEAELAKAEAELALMPPRPSIAAVDHAAVASIRDAAARVAALAPYRPEDEAGMRLIAAIRSVIGRIDVVHTARAEFDATVTLSLTPFVHLGERRAQGVGALTVTAGHRRSPTCPRAAARVAAVLERHATGEFSLSDDDWAGIQDLMPTSRFQRWRACPRNRRAAVDAMVFVALAKAPWHCVPCPSGNHRNLVSFAERLRALGAWEPIAERLATRNPARFGKLMDHRFAPFKGGSTSVKRS